MKLTYLSVVLAAFSSAIASEADITEQPTSSMAVVRVDSPPHSKILEQVDSLADRIRELTSHLSGTGLDQRDLEQASAKLDLSSYLLADKPGFGDILRRQELDVKSLLDTSSLRDQLKLESGKIKIDEDKLKIAFEPLAVNLRSLITESPQLQLDPSAFHVPVPQFTSSLPISMERTIIRDFNHH